MQHAHLSQCAVVLVLMQHPCQTSFELQPDVQPVKSDTLYAAYTHGFACSCYLLPGFKV